MGGRGRVAECGADVGGWCPLVAVVWPSVLMEDLGGESRPLLVSRWLSAPRTAPWGPGPEGCGPPRPGSGWTAVRQCGPLCEKQGRCEVTSRTLLLGRALPQPVF